MLTLFLDSGKISTLQISNRRFAFESMRYWINTKGISTRYQGVVRNLGNV